MGATEHVRRAGGRAAPATALDGPFGPESLVACVGCAALVPAEGIAPDHGYIGASPGCWSTFAGLRGREASDPAYASHGRSITDAYMVQHPGVPGRRSSQSVRELVARLLRDRA